VALLVLTQTALLLSVTIDAQPPVEVSQMMAAEVALMANELGHAQRIVFEIGAAVEPAVLTAVTMQPIALPLSAEASV
jgi:hypothetical protein